MTQRVKKSVLTFIFTIITTVLLAGCIVHVGASKANVRISYDDDHSTVNKSLNIAKGNTIGDASTVNGKLTLNDNITAKDVSSVNGRLMVGNNVSLNDLSTVNGKLSAGPGLNAQGDVTTVNGKIELNKASVVKGNVTSVNGKIEINGVDIQKNIETVNGSVELTGNARVHGNIIYKHRKSYGDYKKSNPVLHIKKDVQIDGDIILQSPVDLEFENEDLHTKVVKNY